MWSKKAWIKNQEIYTQILKLPFIQELINGSLSKEKFNFYIKQDSLYLAEFGKVLSGIASKLSNSADSETFLEFAKDTMTVERSLHGSFLNTNDQNSQASPSCLLYTSYLHKQLNQAPIEVCVAAILPCFWIYKNVGDYILANQTKRNNPYQDWINTYGGESFTIAVEKAIEICDRLAEKSSSTIQNKMTEAFVMASKMEWLFWDSAWNQECWKI